MKAAKPQIVLENSLQAYFYDQLQNLNQKTARPVKNEFIYYSSQVFDNYRESKNFFEIREGGLGNKILGLKLLESEHLGRTQQKRALKEVGDISLLLCGFFYDSLEGKLVDARYYQEIGKTAYKKLGTLVPDLLDIPSFYKFLADTFESLTELISLVSRQLGINGEQNNEMLLFFSNAKRLKVS